MRGNFAALVLLLVGTFFLLTNLGMIHVGLAALFRTWWPLILIVLGLSMFFSGKR